MKPFISLSGFLLISLCFFSCSQDQYISTKDQTDYIVSFDDAKRFVENHMFQTQKSNISLRSNDFGESNTFHGENNLPGLHVFNYENNGQKAFVIISGDQRIPPVLAHGENEFPLDTLPYGVADWMHHEVKYIDSIRSINKSQDDYIANLWNGEMSPFGYNCCDDCPNWPDCQYDPIGCGDIIPCGDENPCGENTYFQYGPLMNTEWGQGCVYNELCPSQDCRCNHTVTGCVATAMAQVINYFKFPNSYDYASILPRYTSADFGTTGADEVARLMFDVGESIDMNWACSSGANTTDVNDALEDDFGYSYGGDFGTYSSTGRVKQNIRWNKPVIFAGCRETATFIFTWGYKGCHAWVCDGYKGHSNNCYSYLFYHMNWGWNNLYNGWYAHGSWSPESSNYQYNKRVLLNINP